eukprot:m.232188 g.232188  ORF g.232188 m.232188 type:complete len:589 (+) comp40077_c1_seq4:199-1965(+)
MTEDVLPSIVSHPHNEIFKWGRNYVDLSCATTLNGGWEEHLKWLHLEDEVKGSLYDDGHRLRIKFPTASDDKSRDKAKPLVKQLSGCYQCETTFTKAYRDNDGMDHPIVLWSKTNPAKIHNGNKKETASEKLAIEIEKLTLEDSVSWPSCSTIAKTPVIAEKFHHRHTKYSNTTAAFCYAFMETRCAADDWPKMRKFALELIFADWQSKAEYTHEVEKDLMQPVVRSVLAEAVGMGIIGKAGMIGFGRDKPDGVIYHDGRAIAIVEMKVEWGQGNEVVQLLRDQQQYAEKRRKTSSLAVDRAFPCFLIGVRGKSISLYGAIHLPESGSTQSLRIHYVLLAKADFVPGRLDECAIFLSKLKVGLTELKRFWSDGGQSMRFGEETGHPLPCDCVAEQLYGSSECRLTGHLKRSVFTGQANGEDVIVKLAASPYGLEAHQCCEEVQLAPQIRKFKQFDFSGSRFCGVVMERLSKDFIPLSYAFFHPWMNADTATKIKEGIKTALDAMHGKDLVHGDLRAANVLVSKEGEVKVIDFDWAGRENEVLYPKNLNYLLVWAKGVRCGKPLQKAHDLCFFRFHCLVLDAIVNKAAK